MAAADPVKVLLADARPNSLRALSGILEGPDYELSTATTGEQAVTSALREDLAVILLEVHTPGLDGLDVAAQLKRHARTRLVPIIFVASSAAEVQHIYKAYAVGAIDSVLEPLDADAVRRKVATFAELHRQRRQNEGLVALRASERRENDLRLLELRLTSDWWYRKLLDGIDHVVAWSAAPETLALTFLSRQAEKVFRCSPEVISQPSFWAEQLHDDDRATFMEAVQRAQLTGEDQALNHRMRAGDGTYRWLHTALSMGSPFVNGPRAVHGLSTDVTELKAAEETAQRASHVREEVLATVVHDLRMPLHVIVATVTLLRHRGQDQEMLAAILRATDRMSCLLADLEDLERVDLGRLVLDRSQHDACDLVTESVALIKPLAKERSLALRIEVSDIAGVRVFCDRERVYRVFTNILSNAIKFSPDGGEIRVQAQRMGDAVRYSISDQGPGIAPDQQERVFERYWQAERVRGRPGLGLGLAIARSIVHLHGGTISVQSRPGAGSSFSFTLPVVA